MAPVASPTGCLPPMVVAPLGRRLGVPLVGLLLLGLLLRRLPIGVRLLGVRLLLPVGVARRGGVPLLLRAVLLAPASSALLLLGVALLLLVVALLLLELLLLVVALLLLLLLLVVALLVLRVALLRVPLLLAVHPLLHIVVCLGVAAPPVLARLLRLGSRPHGLVRLPICRVPPRRRAALGDDRHRLLDMGQGLELHILEALLRRVLHEARPCNRILVLRGRKGRQEHPATRVSSPVHEPGGEPAELQVSGKGGEGGGRKAKGRAYLFEAGRFPPLGRSSQQPPPPGIVVLLVVL